MSAFSVENPHNGKTFENYTRFEWGVEVGVVTTFILRLFVPHEFDMFTPGFFIFLIESHLGKFSLFFLEHPMTKLQGKRFKVNFLLKASDLKSNFTQTPNYRNPALKNPGLLSNLIFP